MNQYLHDNRDARVTEPTYEEAVKTIAPGLYQHFKGNYYKVLGIARHSETTEPMVVYQALYGESAVWVRPAGMWNEVIERDGKRFQRFRRLNQVERISFYEQIFDELSAVVFGDQNEIDEELGSLPDGVLKKFNLLEEYYTSGEWRYDYEADEAGRLPADLKRGVLSQDGVYNLLAMYDGK